MPAFQNYPRATAARPPTSHRPDPRQARSKDGPPDETLNQPFDAVGDHARPDHRSGALHQTGGVKPTDSDHSELDAVSGLRLGWLSVNGNGELVHLLGGIEPTNVADRSEPGDFAPG